MKKHIAIALALAVSTSGLEAISIKKWLGTAATAAACYLAYLSYSGLEGHMAENALRIKPISNDLFGTGDLNFLNGYVPAGYLNRNILPPLESALISASPSLGLMFAQKNIERLAPAQNFGIAELLEGWGDNINFQTKMSGNTLLHVVLHNNHPCIETVRELLLRDSDVSLRNNEGNTPFIDAVEYLSEKSASELITLFKEKTRFDLEARNNRGNTALLEAARNTNLGALKAIINAGGNTTAVNADGYNLLHEAITKINKRHHDSNVIKFLIKEALVDLNAATSSGKTALTIAKENNAKEIAEMITHAIKEKEEATEKDETGNTFLHRAAGGGNLPWTKRLIYLGAKVNEKNNDGNTPLHTAMNSETQSTETEDIVKYLLENGAVTNAKNQDGNTALHIAASNGLNNFVELLLRNGADRTIENNDITSIPTLYTRAMSLFSKSIEHGKTALDLARKNGHHAVVELLTV